MSVICIGSLASATNSVDACAVLPVSEAVTVTVAVPRSLSDGVEYM